MSMGTIIWTPFNAMTTTSVTLDRVYGLSGLQRRLLIPSVEKTFWFDSNFSIEIITPHKLFPPYSVFSKFVVSS